MFGPIPETLEAACIEEALGTSSFNINTINQSANHVNEK